MVAASSGRAELLLDELQVVHGPFPLPFHGVSTALP